MDNVIYHESFYGKQPLKISEIEEGVSVKGILEFDLPVDETAYYNATNGHKYREHITRLVSELDDAVKQAHGTAEADYLRPVLKRAYDLAIDLDIKVNRQ